MINVVQMPGWPETLPFLHLRPSAVKNFFGSSQLRTTVSWWPEPQRRTNALSGLPIALLILSRASL